MSTKKAPAETKTETKPAAEIKAAEPKAPEVVLVTSTQLAEKLGTKGTILRRWLRTLPQFQDSGYTRYKWEPNDPFLKDAEAAFKKFQASDEEKKAKRLEEAREKQAKKDAEPKEAKPKAEKKSKPAPEPESEESEDDDDFEDDDEAEEIE